MQADIKIKREKVFFQFGYGFLALLTSSFSDCLKEPDKWSNSPFAAVDISPALISKSLDFHFDTTVTVRPSCILDYYTHHMIR